MPRRPRVNTGGFAYHVINRAVARDRIFQKDADYAAFEKILAQVYEKMPTRLLGYCLMPNHWHLVLWPESDGELSQFMRLVTVTHTQRWHAHYHSAGTGPLYQGRFKSFPIERDEHLLAVLRYVERNPLRANLVERAQMWEWSSLARRQLPEQPPWLLPTDQWPVPRRGDWLTWVNRPQSAKEVAALSTCIKRGRPYGSDAWVLRTAKELNMESTLRPRGRQRIRPDPKLKDSRPL
jgi:REP-associated tyrosine transposase